MQLDLGLLAVGPTFTYESDSLIPPFDDVEDEDMVSDGTALVNEISARYYIRLVVYTGYSEVCARAATRCVDPPCDQMHCSRAWLLKSCVRMFS